MNPKVIAMMLLFTVVYVVADAGIYYCTGDDSRLWSLGLDSCAVGCLLVAFLVQLLKGRAPK